MFTGIIEEVGSIISIKKAPKFSVLTIQADKIFEDLKIGDSVSTNGVCLTVTQIKGKLFWADVMNETLSRSTLGDLTIRGKVNLERALLANGHFGGHIVSGHIDGTGTIEAIKQDDIAVWYTISTADYIMKYIVEKGSIAIDGISLTVAKVGKHDFSVSVIPHTAKETTLSQKRIGDKVNLENDIIGKYVEKLLSYQNPIESKSISFNSKMYQNQTGNITQQNRENITMEFLLRNGF